MTTCFFARRATLLAVLLCASTGAALPAAAADFRTLDLGAPCTDIAAQEAARGSRPLDGTPPSGYQHAFVSRDLEREVVIGYDCREGRFFRGAYIFTASDESDAASLYAALKKRVSAERGPPTYDFASATHRRRMQEAGATLSRADTLVAFWESARVEVHASVGQPTRQRGWFVSVSYGVPEAQ